MTSYGLSDGEFERLVLEAAWHLPDLDAQAFIRDSMVDGNDASWFREYLNEAISAYADGADVPPGEIRELINDYMLEQYELENFMDYLDWDTWRELMGYEE